MKKFLLLIVAMVAFSAVSASASTSRTDKDGNEVYHHFLVSAQYTMGDFDIAKQSSWYGLGLYVTSFSHWGGFHLGANVDFNINNGFVPKSNSGVMTNFGPSFRVDLGKHLFLNVPVNAVCNASYPEGEDTKYVWGGKVAPSFHGFFNDKVGIFVGPNVTFGKGGKSFGMQAGLSICF